MLTFISCAKTMTARTSVGVPEITVPYFQAEAVQNALDMGQFSAADLERLLRINSKIAAENYLRYQDFFSEANSAMPAICAYTGAVFKRIVPKDFSEDDFSLRSRTHAHHFLSVRTASSVGRDKALSYGRRYTPA